MRRLVWTCLIAMVVLGWARASAADVFEQVHVGTLGYLPMAAPTGARTTITVNGQFTNRGLIATSQIYTRVCDTYVFQQGVQVQPGVAGGKPTAFAYISQTGVGNTFALGPLISQADHTFSMVATGTRWDFAVDGVVFYSFNAVCGVLPAPYYATVAAEQSFPNDNRPIKLSAITIPKAFEFLVDAMWVEPGAGYGYRSMYFCPAVSVVTPGKPKSGTGCSFDAKGKTQIGSMPNNSVVFSGAYRFNPSGFQVW